ncbi:hypothetical protein ACLOAV_006384 [Pseudogymnoascus australis]
MQQEKVSTNEQRDGLYRNLPGSTLIIVSFDAKHSSEQYLMAISWDSACPGRELPSVLPCSGHKRSPKGPEEKAVVITPDLFAFDQHTVVEDDFAREIEHSAVYSAEKKRLLVREFVIQCQLAVAVTSSLLMIYSLSGKLFPTVSTKSDFLKRKYQVEECTKELAKWEDETKLQSTLDGNNLALPLALLYLDSKLSSNTAEQTTSQPGFYSYTEFLRLLSLRFEFVDTVTNIISNAVQSTSSA